MCEMRNYFNTKLNLFHVYNRALTYVPLLYSLIITNLTLYSLSKSKTKNAPRAPFVCSPTFPPPSPAVHCVRCVPRCAHSFGRCRQKCALRAARKALPPPKEGLRLSLSTNECHTPFLSPPQRLPQLQFLSHPPEPSSPPTPAPARPPPPLCNAT